MAETEPPCPNADQHTPAPSSYTGWHHWAARMVWTHRQIRCPGCGLYEIWIPLKNPIRKATTEETNDEA